MDQGPTARLHPAPSSTFCVSWHDPVASGAGRKREKALSGLWLATLVLATIIFPPGPSASSAKPTAVPLMTYILDLATYLLSTAAEG